jgi:hypothetical protein
LVGETARTVPESQEIETNDSAIREAWVWTGGRRLDDDNDARGQDLLLHGICKDKVRFDRDLNNFLVDVGEQPRE